MMLEIIIVLTVAILSIFFAIVGIGGASVYIPLFYSFGFLIKEAIIVGLILNLVSSLTSIITHYKVEKFSTTDYKYVSWIFLGIIFGSYIGSKLFFILDTTTLKALFSTFLLIVAYKTYSDQNKNREKKARSYPKISKIEKFLIGSLMGLIASLFGIGGGIFLVPFFLHKNIEINKASFLSHICVFFSSLVAFSLNFNFELIVQKQNLILFLVAAAAIGSKIGSEKLVDKKIGQSTFRKLLSLIIVFFSIKIFLDVLKEYNLNFL
ncbi:MAG: sulfite exporter TauE/SafE family protein [Candidatus Micrarchaeota archaeon]|nr:sulfite exporter TauE/SafE family protein [Candidatus Micrarchaeota archaeon]